jgi:putative toxin-antitoxin system antitoxin component (TIGR02293 family)|tara:strand:- start:29 stop:292 length:264 start_codon:yes stop_codon:yes gene_type:complete
MIARVKAGLKFFVVERIEKGFGVTQKEVAQVLCIPPSTLNRRKQEGVLHSDESDRVVRLAGLKYTAIELMQGDDDVAVAWLRTPLDI